MAERRMFAKSVTGSARFLKLPDSARLLNCGLGREADDDGVVEAFGVLRKTGGSEEDLRTLIDRGFLLELDGENLVVHIRHWAMNNLIRKDRYRPSAYGDLLRERLCAEYGQSEWISFG